MARMYNQSRMTLVTKQNVDGSDSLSSSSGSVHFSDDGDSSSNEFFDWDSSIKKETNAVLWVLANEAYCFDIEKFSEKFVNATFIEAKKAIHAYKPPPRSAEVIYPLVEDLVNRASDLGTAENVSKHSHPPISPTLSSFDLSESPYKFWPRVSEFNIKLGLEKIEDYVNTWKRSPDWMFCVEFLGFECEDCSNVFVYEVEWSKPTPEYPIPQATASVYFAMEVFKMIPYTFDRSVGVTYVFESSNLIHHPGKIHFQEKWLQDIIDIKIKFYKKFTFGKPFSLTSYLMQIIARI